MHTHYKLHSRVSHNLTTVFSYVGYATIFRICYRTQSAGDYSPWETKKSSVKSKIGNYL